MTKLMNRNLAAKLVAVFFAMILWLYVMSVINPRVTSEQLNIPVQLVNESVIRQSGLVVFGQPEPTIRVRLTGNRDQVHRISREQIEARLDLRGYTEGVNSIPIEVNVPGGVEVDWSPKFATIELERIISRQKEVSVEIEGQAASGYVLGEPELRPSLVWIEGPESYVNSVERVLAQLTLEDQQENLSVSLPLRAVNSRGEEVNQVDVRSTSVDLFVAVDQLKSVAVDMNLDIETAENYQVVSTVIEPINVTIQGQAGLLSGINRISTESLVLEELSESQEIEVFLAFPEGVRGFERQSVIVRINVEEVLEETYVVQRESYRIMNLSADLVLEQETLPERMEITVRALESIIENLDPRTIQVYVDLDDLEAGIHLIEPDVRLPMNMEMSIATTAISPESFSVELTPRE
ncbi:CdaR family protein [Anoxynatronum buryatiense]|uniref:YbbR domain-containing protein n=1 Tax=Anoxynatronum buryatiense TaxID=489973 RepID=A0AA45WZQ6_9CLOT|nr:CdaR family protein [Anoxynatronum buryatiense]SMP69191.1 YbbR domain-containing protein [Anoxynatronum buryatiense]